MRKFAAVWLLAGALLGAGTAAKADDLTGADFLLCTAVLATVCDETGDCEQDVPWNLNIPQFIQIDLKGKKLATTRASGENRSTTIDVVKRDAGTIVLQGFERGRAFSFVISEDTGMASVAVAAPHRAVAVFGSCTTIDALR